MKSWQKSPPGGRRAPSLPVELSLVWHQPEPPRAPTPTRLHRQPLGWRRPAVGAAGGAQLPWVAEGLGGVAEGEGPRMKQGSPQPRWDGRVAELGLKCREDELHVKSHLQQPARGITSPVPGLQPGGTTSERCQEAPSTQRNRELWLHRWSISYGCVLLNGDAAMVNQLWLCYARPYHYQPTFSLRASIYPVLKSKHKVAPFFCSSHSFLQQATLGFAALCL